MPRGAEMGFSLGLGIAHGIFIVSYCELPNSIILLVIAAMNYQYL